jgi:hydrogenase-4 component F
MPLVLLLAVPLAAAFVSLRLRRRAWLEAVHLVSAAVVFAASLLLTRDVLASGSVNFFEGFLYADHLSALVVLLTAFVYFITAPYTIGFLRGTPAGEAEDSPIPNLSPRQLRDYYSLTSLFLFALLLVTLTGNLGVMWIALEGATLSSIFLVAFYGKPTSLEAAWKYAIIGGVGLSMALFGTILTYFAAHQTTGAETWQALNWPFLLAASRSFDPLVMRLAFILVLLGYGTKAGLAPMHTWKPDAYSEAPVPVAALMASAMLNCALYGVARFALLTSRSTGAAFSSHLLMLFGLLSIAVAVPFIVVQRSYRRLLAYSSIDHCGLMALGFGFGGVFGPLGSLLHMIFHSAAKPLLFFCAGNAQRHTGNDSLRNPQGGLIHALPITGAAFFIAVLAVTGTPPLAVFQSEFTILRAGFVSGYPWLTALAIALLVAIFAGMFTHVVKLVFGPPPANSTRGDRDPWTTSPLVIIAALLLVLGLWMPAPLVALVKGAAQILEVRP